MVICFTDLFIETGYMLETGLILPKSRAILFQHITNGIDLEL